MISRELRAGLPLELLYADDLILMAESVESLHDKIVQEAQLMLTNPRDAFISQSRSPNIAPFHMLGIVSSCAIVTSSLIGAVFLRYSTSIILKSGSEVTQGH